MREQSRYLGDLIGISDDDYPLFDTGSIEEKDALVSQAIEDEYVSGDRPLYALTRGGKEFLAERPVERRVFLSHATDDAGIAEVLANAIRERLAGSGVEVFVSSQSGNIPTGKKWLDVVETKLITGTTYLVLITPRSVLRPWLWFETGSFWFKERQIIVLCADGYSKGNVPYPLGSIQVLSLDLRDDIVTLFEKDLGTTAPDVNALLAAFKARSMGGLAHVSFAGSEWIWTGALGALEDRDAVAPPPGLKEEFEGRGFRWRCGDPNKEGHWSEKGLFPLYQADPRKWKRKLRCPIDEKQIIYVKAPPPTEVDGLKEQVAEQAEEIQRLRRAEPPPKEKPSGTKWGCYQFKDEGEKLYCTACWDSKGMKSLTNRMNIKQRSCPVCRAVIGAG